MLNRHNLDIAALASKDVSRFTLKGILVSPKETVETDGRQLVRVSTPPEFEAASFPELPGTEAATDEFKPFVLPTQTALEVAKALPKRQTIRILETAGVSAETNKDGDAVLLTTDLESPRVFRTKKLTGNFPDFERVIPSRRDTTFRIAFNADLLGRVLQQAIKFKKGDDKAYIELSFTDSASAVRLDAKTDGQEFTGVIMPFRLASAPVRDGKPCVWKPERPDWAFEDSDCFEPRAVAAEGSETETAATEPEPEATEVPEPEKSPTEPAGDLDAIIAATEEPTAPAEPEAAPAPTNGKAPAFLARWPKPNSPDSDGGEGRTENSPEPDGVPGEPKPDGLRSSFRAAREKARKGRKSGPKTRQAAPAGTSAPGRPAGDASGPETAGNAQGENGAKAPTRPAAARPAPANGFECPRCFAPSKNRQGVVAHLRLVHGATDKATRDAELAKAGI